MFHVPGFIDTRFGLESIDSFERYIAQQVKAMPR